MEERLERNHPILHGIITGILGFAAMALTIVAAVLIWAVM